MAKTAREMTPPQAELVARVRALLPGEPEVREVTMFGGRVFMLRERMLVGVGRDGGLLVRVDPDRHLELLEREGAAQAFMGAGRSMGAGWITVEPGAIEGEDALLGWIDEARDWHTRAEAAG